jgi:hypothetical protein
VSALAANLRCVRLCSRGLTYGLSRMVENHKVRFLGEVAAAMPPPHPTRNRRGVSRRGLAACQGHGFGPGPI